MSDHDHPDSDNKRQNPDPFPGHASEDATEPIRALYPTLSEQELKEAEATLLQYFEIALDIYEDQTSNHIDTSPAFPKMKERSKSLKI
jgi:hypothetical protein